MLCQQLCRGRTEDESKYPSPSGWPVRPTFLSWERASTLRKGDKGAEGEGLNQSGAQVPWLVLIEYQSWSQCIFRFRKKLKWQIFITSKEREENRTSFTNMLSVAINWTLHGLGLKETTWPWYWQLGHTWSWRADCLHGRHLGFHIGNNSAAMGCFNCGFLPWAEVWKHKEISMSLMTHHIRVICWKRDI